MLQWFGLGCNNKVEDQGPSETGESSTRSSGRRRRKDGAERRAPERQQEELETNRTCPITDVATDYGGTTIRTEIATDYGGGTLRSHYGEETFRTDYGGLISGVSDGPWSCPACTFQNGPDNVACEVCGNPRVMSEAPGSKASRVPNSWHTTLEEEPLRQESPYVVAGNPAFSSSSSVHSRMRTASFDNTGRYRQKDLELVHATRHQSMEGRDALDATQAATEQALLSRQLSAQEQGSFREGSLRGGSFREGSLRGGSFREGSLRGGSFREGSLRGGSFREGSVRGGSFRESSFREGSFRELMAQNQGIDRLSTSHASVVSQSLETGLRQLPASEGAAVAVDPHRLSKVRLRVIRAYDLQNKDWGIIKGDVSDPFVVMKMGDQQHKTETINDNLNPEWNSAPFEFDVSNHSDAVLHLEVFNSNYVAAHDSLGSMEVLINSLVPGQTQPILAKLDEGKRSDGLQAKLEIEVELLIPEIPTGPPIEPSFAEGLPMAREEPSAIYPGEEQMIGPMSTATFAGDEGQGAAAAAVLQATAGPVAMAGAGSILQSSAPYFPQSFRPQEKFWVPLPSFQGYGPEAFLPPPPRSASSTAAVPNGRLTTVPEYESKANLLGMHDYSREPTYYPRQQQVDLESWREDPFYGWRKDNIEQDINGQQALGTTTTVRPHSRYSAGPTRVVPESDKEWEQRKEVEEQWKKDPFHGWLGVHESEQLEKTTDSILGVREARNLMKLPSFREADVKRFADNREYSKLHKVAPRQHWAAGSREKDSSAPEQIWKDDAFYGWLPGRGHPDQAEQRGHPAREQARLNSLPSFSEDLPGGQALLHGSRQSAYSDVEVQDDLYGSELSRQSSRMGSSRGRRQPPQSGAQRKNNSTSSFTVERIKSSHSIETSRAMGELGVLSVRVIAAFSLINTDTGILGDVSDPYVKLWLASQSDNSKRTHTISNDLDPVWNSSPFLFPLHVEDDMLHLEVYDEDTFTADDFLGRITIPLQNIVRGQPNRAVRIRDALQDIGHGELEVEIGFSPG